MLYVYLPDLLSDLSSDFDLKFSTSGITDYVSVEHFYTDVTEMSVAFWMRTSDKVNYGTVFSYATDDHFNAITITYFTGSVQLYFTLFQRLALYNTLVLLVLHI